MFINNFFSFSFFFLIQLSIGIDNGIIEIYNADFELQFTHKLNYIVGMCKMIARRTCANSFRKYSDFTIIPTSKIHKSSSDATTINGTDDDRLIMNIIGPEHGIIYLLKDPRDPLLHIYLYESDSMDDVSTINYQLSYYKVGKNLLKNVNNLENGNNFCDIDIFLNCLNRAQGT